MSEHGNGTALRKCQKCQVDMNRDMLDARGMCLHCKAQPGVEQQKNQNGKRASVTYSVNEMMESEPDYSDFISCHRSGRRNAIPDLQGDAAALRLEKLAATMDEISVTEEDNQEAEDAEKEHGMTPKNEDDRPTL